MTSTRTDATQITYWRTGKGSHRHTDQWCANGRRAIHTGDVTVIPAEQVKDWAPCEFCCAAEEIKAHFSAPAQGCTATRPVEGSYNPRLYTPRGTCPDCGKTGIALSKLMNLRKH